MTRLQKWLFRDEAALESEDAWQARHLLQRLGYSKSDLVPTTEVLNRLLDRIELLEARSNQDG